MIIQRKATSSPSTAMRLTLGLVLYLSIANPGFAADDADSIRATINTPILTLLQHPHARAVVEKHLPSLVTALDDDYDAREFFGSSSLLELSIDDAHVVCFDEELLEKLKVELAALGDSA